MNIDREIKEDAEYLAQKYKRLLFEPKPFVPGETYISVARAMFDEDELAGLLEASIRFKMVDGEITDKFEREMARFLGVRSATFVNSGSSANLLAIMALTSPLLGSKALQSGDEIITNAVGFPTTVAPILQAGCIPVFVDCNLGSYNPMAYTIEDAITEKTRAIFLAHTLGNPFDLEKIKLICEQNGLWLIEDCADALGSKWDNKKVGTFGTISTTSFYPAHMMTTGEGGMVFTDTPLLSAIIRSFRDWGRACWCPPNKDNTCGKRFGHTNLGELPDYYDHKYVYSHLGYNLKSTDLQAAIGLEQLKKLPELMEKRKNNFNYLLQEFVRHELDRYFILPFHDILADVVPFGFPLTIKEGKLDRNNLVQYLEKNKIGTRPLFGGNLTRHPAFVNKGRIHEQSLPKADLITSNSFWIGCHPGMTDEMVDYVVRVFNEFVRSQNAN